MEPQELFVNIVILGILTVVVGVLLGFDMSLLIDALPHVVAFALGLALTLAVLRAVFG